MSSPAWGRGLKLHEGKAVCDVDSSSPAWGRGLKSCPSIFETAEEIVVPRVGTWIEIASIPRCLSGCLVVPRVGTWIEIFGKVRKIGGLTVVPRVGTWIEISPSGSRRRQKRLSPAWKRGLKSQDGSRDTNGNIVVPCVETWIEKIIRMGVRPYYRQQYNVFLAPRQRAWIGLKKGQHFHSGKTLSKEGCGEVLHKSPMLWIRRTERSASGIHWNLDRVPQR